MWVCFSDGGEWRAEQHASATAARDALAAALRRDQAAGRTVTPAIPVADPDQLYHVTAGTHLVGFYCLSPEHPADWTGSWSLYEAPVSDADPAPDRA